MCYHYTILLHNSKLKTRDGGKGTRDNINSQLIDHKAQFIVGNYSYLLWCMFTGENNERCNYPQCENKHNKPCSSGLCGHDNTMSYASVIDGIYSVYSPYLWKQYSLPGCHTIDNCSAKSIDHHKRHKRDDKQI